MANKWMILKSMAGLEVSLPNMPHFKMRVADVSLL